MGSPPKNSADAKHPFFNGLALKEILEEMITRERFPSPWRLKQLVKRLIRHCSEGEQAEVLAALDAWMADHPELVRKVQAGFLKSRLNSDANMYLAAEKDARLELSLKEHQDPDEWKPSQTVAHEFPDLSDEERSDRIASILDTARARRDGSTLGGSGQS